MRATPFAALIFMRSSDSPSRGHCRAQLFGYGLLDDRALEEVRVVARVQARGIAESEFAEVLLLHVALLDRLECFRDHFPEIGHVEMREVGAEDRAQPDAHAGIESHHR